METFEIETDVIIYNGISDNDDSINDHFEISCSGFFGQNRVRIYNRNGTLVYEQEHYDSNDPDKRFNGDSNTGIGGAGGLPVGTYFYIFDKGDGSGVIQGYLELVR